MDLFEAIEAGNVSKVSFILAEDPSLAGSRSATGVSALLWARYRGQSEMVDALLAADPSLDVFDAAALGRLPRLAELIDEDPGQANAWSADGFTPVGLAAFFGRPDAVKYLIGRGADVHAVARNPMRVQPLHAAAAARSAEAVRLILEAGADPDAQQQKGFTALMAARVHGDDEIIQLLLAHGAHDPAEPAEQADPAGPAGPADPADRADSQSESGNRSSTS
ncbi:MAG TPA: ankyrin repeat domain-containing protein [Acidimicrobiales bacterium]|nr:ankyrin repeat domain-containing protein [Acidimicrobiales bacterium]